MQALLEFTSGPLFRFSLVVAVLGMAAQFGQNALVVARSAATWQAGVKAVLRAIFSWVLPARRAKRFGLAGEILLWVVVAGVVIEPLFYLGHARLWGRSLHLDWPAVPAAVSDVLTKLTMVALVLLLVVRAASAQYRAVMLRFDWLPMILALFAFVSGYLVAHPGRSPMSPDLTALVHFASADGLLLTAPFTRLARCVLLPEAFDKAIQHRQEVSA